MYRISNSRKKNIFYYGQKRIRKKMFFFIMAKNECLFNEQVVRRFNKKNIESDLQVLFIAKKK